MRYHNISKDDFLNGDGIRAVLFVSGCTHHCKECHNPITWEKDGGVVFDDAAKAELFEYLKKPYVTGITFSGGDPLAIYNREEVLSLIKEVKEAFPDKTVWVYTGWTKEELIDQGFWDKLAPNIDVIVEGKFEIDKKQVSYRWAGSTNQRVLRKESNFELNTSSQEYIAVEKLEKALSNAKIRMPGSLYYAVAELPYEGVIPDASEIVAAIEEDLSKIGDLNEAKEAMSILCQVKELECFKTTEKDCERG